MNQLKAEYEQEYGAGNYIPPVRQQYWSMRIMAYAGTLVFAVAALGAFLMWRSGLERTRWFLWAAVGSIALPYVSALAGWVLSRSGGSRGSSGLLKTADANSPAWGRRPSRSASASSRSSTGCSPSSTSCSCATTRRSTRRGSTARSDPEPAPALGY